MSLKPVKSFSLRSVTDFFNTEYVNWGSYDNLRKIGSLVDGQKNAARKVLWYTLQKNQKNEIKVSQLDSKVAESEEYLHGSMVGVIVNLAKDYPGSNNMNLMYPEGNFGTRLIPEASAGRYIYSYGTNEFFDVFSKDDNAILNHQTFEGNNIEPVFMLPKLPMLLINGSEGVTSGYAQKILPRDPKELNKYLRYYLNKPDAVRKPFQNKPYFKGFNGTVEQGETNKQWLIKGAFTRKANKVFITELPIGYNLKSYIKVLDKLEDLKKITSYDDKSQDDFKFVVHFNRKQLDSLSDDKLMEYLKLTKKVSELYTVMDQNNKVQTFDNINDIFWAYFQVKMEFLAKRKVHLIESITQDIKLMISKYTFVKGIIDDTIVITKRPTEDIIRNLENTPRILKVDDSFDYLLNMSIRMMTEERTAKLVQQIKNAKVQLDFTKSATPEMMWLEDLN